jgi:hypothetical protein
MATNPRMPDSRGPELQKPTGGLTPQPPKSGVTGTILAIIVAVLLLGAIVYFLPRAPKATPAKPAAEVVQQPTGSEIQVQSVNLSKSPTGGSINLQGMLSNTGRQTINGVAMQVIFHGKDGAVLETQPAKVMGLKKEGNSFVENELTKSPLQPHETRPFRVTVETVPQDWNQQMPELRVSAVTSHP